MKEIRQWVSAPDPDLNFHKALDLRLDTTGNWLLTSDQYRKWKCNSKTFLWIHGKPGSGKTILSAAIIEDVLQTSQGNGVMYFYFDFNDEAKQAPENMLRSIFRQLCHRSIAVPQGVWDLFAKCSNGKHVPSSIELLDAIEQTIREVPRCFLIIDALDECKARESAMKFLCRFHSTLDNLRILITSRRLTDIELTLQSILSPEQCVNLEDSPVNDDIRHYIHDHLENDVQLKKWKDNASMRAEIEVSLMEKAHGM
jgi:Cdc6-like AAA superfamily ATPase